MSGQVKQLPVNANPGFESECYHNLRLSAVLAEQSWLSWGLSHFVNLIVRGRPEGQMPMVRFEEHLEVYSGVLDEHRLAEEYAPRAGTIHTDRGNHTAAIRKAIDEGQYVIIYLDWSRVPCSSYYRQGRALVHDALIYGYDDTAQVFDVLAFEVDGRSYAPVRISYAVCERELEGVIREHSESQLWFTHYGFPLSSFRVWPASGASGVQRLDTRAVYFALDRGRIQASALAPDAYASGYYVNLYLSMFFSSLADGGRVDPRENDFWNIMIHKMTQHKRWMLLRIEALEQLADSPLLQHAKRYYTQTRRVMKEIRAESLKVQRQPDSSRYERLAGLFRTLYEQEKRAVPLLMEHLVRMQSTGNGGNQDE